MFANQVKSILVSSSSCLPSLWTVNRRGMATLKMISMRLKSVKNIQKITQSMKMVSAAKYTRAERELKLALAFGDGSQAFYEQAEVTPPENAKNELIIAISSDRGLCGAVHTSVGRLIRSKLQNKSDNVKVVCVGDKARALLQRLFGQNILYVAKEIGRSPPTFEDAARVATAISDSGFEYDSGTIVYNKFKSVVSYTTSQIPIYSVSSVNSAPKITLYDSVDPDVLQNYIEFSLASQLYYAMKENACSEQSSRMTAMDNASKNAAEMIEKLSLAFNRTRQAVITRELIEIISGASAL
ncbi:unnamed protein product [Orchesella dallaii]|uniref:ATP synthase subunit gamma n=1 Tax=Orchesella dallaii TaxID=48710 RepID=A0ABP1QN53_9HEXA